ncbi:MULTISPECIES: pilus assembly PilX family protein [unclassified Variovorax]|uniref:pilus assembly PilX family protein n=1 Tax=unclassified Variovorax TaxID=663243 RepID=UPI003F45EB4C
MSLRAARQRGFVLLFCLIVLVILLAGGVAVVRSMNTSLTSAGNLAFRRDLVNQGERAVSLVLAKFAGTGTLANATDDLPGENFKATKLDTNTQGVPNALLDDKTFAAVGKASNDIADAAAQVSIRYVIDRLCGSTGPATSTGCVQSSAAPAGGTVTPTPPPAPPTATIYRLSLRVSGPRDTQVFMQSTFTKPD